MPDVLVKDLPVKVHKWLKEQAKLNHRSMNMEIRHILETHLFRRGVPDFKAIKVAKPLTQKFIRQAIREGRA